MTIKQLRELEEQHARLQREVLNAAKDSVVAGDIDREALPRLLRAVVNLRRWEAEDANPEITVNTFDWGEL